MTPIQTQNKRMDEMLSQAFAVRGGSDTLSARLDEMRRTHRVAQLKQQQRRRFMRRGFALASAACAVLFAVTILPKVLIWRALAQMADAVGSAHSVHSIVWTIEADGSRRKTREMWYQGGRSRTETSREITINTGDRAYFYRPGERVAMWRHNEASTRQVVGFSIRAISADLSRRNPLDKLILSPDEQTIDGRRARVATVEPAHERIRIVLYAEPETMLVFRFEVLRLAGDSWSVSETGTMEYNRPLRAWLFEPRFSKGTYVGEVGVADPKWLASLKKPRVVAHVGNQRIAIRDIQMNERGDIFVLYTAGRAQLKNVHDLTNGTTFSEHQVPNVDFWLEHADKTRMLRVWPWAYPFQVLRNPNRVIGVHVDGEPLRWAVWAPHEPLTTPIKSAQRVTLGVYKPLSSNYTARRPIEVRTRIKTLATFTIPRATFTRVPVYVRYFGKGMNENDYLNELDKQRVTFWSLLPSTHPKRKAGIEKALRFQKAIIERTARQWRQDGNQGVQTQAWLTIAELCLELKLFDETREALGRAEEDNRIYGSDTKRIEEFRNRLDAIDRRPKVL